MEETNEDDGVGTSRCGIDEQKDGDEDNTSISTLGDQTQSFSHLEEKMLGREAGWKVNAVI